MWMGWFFKVALTDVCLAVSLCLCPSVRLSPPASEAICQRLSPAVVSPVCLYICLPSRYVHHCFKGLLLYPPCHTSAWRHRGWAGTPGSVALGQLDLLPARVDNTFRQSGQRGTVGPEKSMRWQYWAEVSLTKPDHPANVQTKKKQQMHLISQWGK